MGMLKRRLKQEEEGEDMNMVEDADPTMHEDDSEDSTSSEEEDDEAEDREDDMDADAATLSTERLNKTKVMILASRGVNARQRHLMDDLVMLMPHAKKESKFDTKRDLFALNELAELNGCNHILFFESRKPQELFLWASKSPGGPSVRFHVQNIHTLEELHLTGNSMKNTRPILTFDPIFGETAHGQVIKSLLEGIFGTPKNHRKTRPYIDRVMHFGWSDDRIWIRNYQISEGVVEEAEKAVEGLSLTEIGPRLLLHPVRVFEASFSGRTLWQNPNYMPASVIQSKVRMHEAVISKQRNINRASSFMRKKEAVLPDNELDHVFD